MFLFLLGVLILAANFLGSQWTPGPGPGVITMPIRGRARWAALTLALALLLAGAANAQNAYITNTADNTVSVIDTATNKVVGDPILVGTKPADVAVTPD